METLGVLEQKIEQLVSLIKKLKSENNRLVKENQELSEIVHSFENARKEQNHDLNELHKEREVTKGALDNLIKSIETLMSSEHSQ